MVFGEFPAGGWSEWIQNSKKHSPYYGLSFFSGDQERMFIARNGHIGIGTNRPGSFKLAVEGKIGAREIRITQVSPWPDYVFAPGYALRTLTEVEQFIQKHQHLPDVPSAQVVAKEGILVGQMNATLLRKIEELTLYMIELKKQVNKSVGFIKQLQQEVTTLKQENQQLKQNPKK
ncbi:hypothetical protein M23134_02987 [Microscilla marina ATCC 23134]|uniref:Uncharacterized protein n=1 Tax=Microscilla marina ATCC 23134 TaxID=313606 RepID=A1ZSI8_MICM2|nr:hypothetical protein M23134_02987 [Microscilla marina ATCC 23134]